VHGGGRPPVFDEFQFQRAGVVAGDAVDDLVGEDDAVWASGMWR
jgi:hypothetical protein